MANFNSQPAPGYPADPDSKPTTVADRPPTAMAGSAAVYIAPTPAPTLVPGKSVFLAGSIEMGTAEEWQPRMTKSLEDITCTVFNPRRKNWDKDWEQRKDNEQFRWQVEWELALLRKADVIAMYFDPNTKSPITLLELGLHLVSKDAKQRPKLLVCCPEGFYRLGNVEIVCGEVGIPIIPSYEEFVAAVRERLQEPN